jgi:DNA-binding PadR family transcriptional regulator
MITLDTSTLVMRILQEVFTSIPIQDLKRRIYSYSADTSDDKIEEAIRKLKQNGLIDITEEQVGTRSERLVTLTGRGIGRSASAAM